MNTAELKVILIYAVERAIRLQLIDLGLAGCSSAVWCSNPAEELVVVLLDVLPDAALVQLLADVNVDVGRDRDLDDVAIGHRDLDGRVGVSEAVPGPLELFLIQKLLQVIKVQVKSLMRYGGSLMEHNSLMV